MTREQIIEGIKSFNKKFHQMYVEAHGTDFICRITVEIAEAEMGLKLQDHIDDEGLGKIFDSLVEEYNEIIELNAEKKAFKMTFSN